MGEAHVDHVAEAIEYAHQVLAGEIPACKWVKAAAQRQLDDLARWRGDRAPAGWSGEWRTGDAWPYEWRPELADRAIRFIELLPHVKGGQGWEAGAPIRLMPAQKFSVACVFGWVRKDSGTRRFRTVYEEVPRKNAKTTKLAPLCLYMLTADGYAPAGGEAFVRDMGAEVYSAATKEEQARIVFEIAQQMARLEPEFRARFGVEVFRKSLAVRETASAFKPLAADADSLDGLNISFAAVDELHAHKTRAVYDVLDSGRGSRAQPLLWSITTAGSNRAGVCYDVRSYLVKILSSVLKRHGGLGYEVKGEVAEDETFWGVIYTIDDGDDPFDEQSWRKANPLYGVSVDPEDLRRMATVAQVQAQALNEFLTKRLNVWVNADAAWMNMLQWDACGDRALAASQFAGEPCVAALDAAFKKDLFAKVRVFRRVAEGAPHYYVFGRYYAPEALTQAKGNEHLAGWVREGWIRTTPGEVLDIEAVREELVGAAEACGGGKGKGAPAKAAEGGVTRAALEAQGDVRRFELLEVPYDPAQLTQFATELLGAGVPAVEIRPTVLNFSPAMKEVEELVASRRLHHDGDPVLAWAVANVVCHRDAKDNIYPRKDDPAKKIDPAIALFMAIARWLANPVPEPSVYAKRGVIVL